MRIRQRNGVFLSEPARDIAVASGATYYISKTPCNACGAFKRYVKSYACFACAARVARDHYRKKRAQKPAGRPMPDLCECCGRPPNVGRTVKIDPVLTYDHDHTTGAFRGWLCNHCNTGMGLLGDNLMGVLRAVDYLLRNG